jgi:hypothetical protein
VRLCRTEVCAKASVVAHRTDVTARELLRAYGGHVAARRQTIILSVVTAVIVALAVVALVFSVGSNVTDYDDSSPEGVAQSYLTASFDGDFDRAAEFFETGSTCDADDLDRAFIQDSVRISLVEVSVDGDRARVRISAEIPSGGPLGGFYGEEHTLRLVRIDDQWRLTGVPWPLYDCNEPGK